MNLNTYKTSKKQSHFWGDGLFLEGIFYSEKYVKWKRLQLTLRQTTKDRQETR